MFAALYLYLRCVFANKFTFFGYLITIVGSVLYFADNRAVSAVGILVVSSGMQMLLMTAFGGATMDHYKRAKKLFAHYGPTDEIAQRYRYGAYCSRAGYLLALRDWKKHQA